MLGLIVTGIWRVFSFLDISQLGLVGFGWAEVEGVARPRAERGGRHGDVSRSDRDEGEHSKKESWKGPAEAWWWRLSLRWLRIPWLHLWVHLCKVAWWRGRPVMAESTRSHGHSCLSLWNLISIPSFLQRSGILRRRWAITYGTIKNTAHLLSSLPIGISYEEIICTEHVPIPSLFHDQPNALVWKWGMVSVLRLWVCPT